MEGLNWDMLASCDYVNEDTVDNVNEFAGTDLLLEENFESEIVSKRFQEGGRLTFNSPVVDSHYEGTFGIV